MEKKLNSLQKAKLEFEKKNVNSVSKKKTAKKVNRTQEEEEDTSKLSYAFFEMRERKRPDWWMKKLSRDLIDKAYENEKVIAIEDICIPMGIHRQRLYEWDKEFPDLKAARDFALEIIGMRREHDVYEKKVDKCFLDYQSQFLSRYQEFDKQEDARKVELAAKGVATGTTNITINDRTIVPNTGLVPDKKDE